MAREEKTIANNKKAFHDYFVDETFEAGIALTGTEVKSLRENGASLRESFATVTQGRGVAPRAAHRAVLARQPQQRRAGPLAQAAAASQGDPLPDRQDAGSAATRSFRSASTSRRSNLVKVELGLARGKKLYDKRDAIAERDSKRDAERELRDRTKGE